MTNKELIEKRIPYPLSEMVMRNGVRSWGEQWLDLNTDETFAHSLLLGAFTFSNTPEGHMFWYNLKDKLKAKNL